MKHTTDSANRSRFIGLPGFQKAEADLEAKGKPSCWIFETVDTNDPNAFFLKSGKPWYRSECPCYKGYWLHGGIGSVQCSKCNTPLPGLLWDCVCSKDHTACPVYLDKPWAADSNGQIKFF